MDLRELYQSYRRFDRADWVSPQRHFAQEISRRFRIVASENRIPNDSERKEFIDSYTLWLDVHFRFTLEFGYTVVTWTAAIAEHSVTHLNLINDIQIWIYQNELTSIHEQPIDWRRNLRRIAGPFVTRQCVAEESEVGPSISETHWTPENPLECLQEY